MKSLKIAGLLAAVCALTLAPTTTFAEKNAKVSAHDKAWAEMTAASDLTEITLAKAALEKSQNEAVKSHAQKMINDHEKTSAQLKDWAKANDVDLKNELPKPKKAMVDEITSKSGAEFDQAYLEHEVAGHRMAASHFKNGAQFNKDAKLKDFAASNLPTIEQHLAEVEKGHGHAHK